MKRIRRVVALSVAAAALIGAFDAVQASADPLGTVEFCDEERTGTIGLNVGLEPIADDSGDVTCI